MEDKILAVKSLRFQCIPYSKTLVELKDFSITSNVRFKGQSVDAESESILETVKHEEFLSGQDVAPRHVEDASEAVQCADVELLQRERRVHPPHPVGAFQH